MKVNYLRLFLVRFYNSSNVNIVLDISNKSNLKPGTWKIFFVMTQSLRILIEKKWAVCDGSANTGVLQVFLSK